ncbi:MAG: glycosyltransferase family 2 protein [Actinomycetota bacterium]|nr:glycosyltransferase family 2 protein [Actinomycetota bacterium]
MTVYTAASWFYGTFDTAVLVYFVLINSSYLLLILLAAWQFAGHLRRLPFAGLEETYASPLTMPVSVLVPAHNEQAVIVQSVRAMLALRYPVFEVIVIDDGSSDGTFAALESAFGLVEVPRVLAADVPTRVELASAHVPADGRSPLLVLCKPNSGRSDAINMGINAASHPIVCMVDADSLLDPDALLTVGKPFADDPQRVVATGGVIRAANGCSVVAGRVVDVRMPRQWLARIQVVEYLRAFLLGRTGWSRLGALLVISGAFGMFRRDVVVTVGGLDPDCIGEDFELVMRVHRHMRRTRQDYRIVFVSEPVSWTEVPTTPGVLRSQRRRWHRGLVEVLWKYRGMICNPRYGRVGLIGLPYYVVFELLAPVIELAGLVLLPIGLMLGLVDGGYAVLFLLVAYGYALLLSMAALAVEEFSFHRYTRWRDLLIAAVAAIAENLAYRQLTAWWRLEGMYAAMRRRRQVWGVMTRTGFDTVETPMLVGSHS